MKKLTMLVAAAALLAVAVSSCKKEEKIPDPTISSSPEKITAPAESEGIKVEVTISANRSWTASIDKDWAYISGTKSYTNTTNQTESVVLTVKFEENSEYVSRSAVLKISGTEVNLQIPITQDAKINTNVVTSDSEKDYSGIPYWGKKTVNIIVKSNTSWVASFDEGRTSNLGILQGDTLAAKTMRFNDDTVKVQINRNKDTKDVSTKLTIIDADGRCTPLVFTFQQDKAPEVLIDSTGTRLCNVACYGMSREVKFTAAGAWKASVSGDATVDKASGDAGSASVVVSFPANETGKDRQSTLTVSSGSSKFDLVITQNRAADYTMFFRKYPDAYSKDVAYRTWVGDDKYKQIAEDGTENYGLYLEKMKNNVFGYFTLTAINKSISASRIKVGLLENNNGTTTTGNVGYNEYCFFFGINKDNYGGFVEFPAIEGKKLTRVEAFGAAQTANQVVRVSICDKDGNILPGTKEMRLQLNNLSAAKKAPESVAAELQESPEAYGCWEVPDAKENTVYKLRLSTRAMVRWINFYYE